MKVSVIEAEGQLTELVARADAGEEVILVRDGRPVARLVPVVVKPDRSGLEARIEAIQASAAAKMTPGPSAARSQDFLYDDDGLPG